jgi:hypothetical protein
VFPRERQGGAHTVSGRAGAASEAAPCPAWHFHRPTDAPAYTYPGNPDPLTFGEAGDRAAVLLTVAADGAASRKRFPVALDLDLIRDVTRARVLEDLRARVMGSALAHALTRARSRTDRRVVWAIWEVATG